MFERRTSLPRYRGRMLSALFILAIGTAQLLYALYSTPRVITGTVVHLSQFHDRSSFSNFDIQSKDHALVPVQCDYTGDHLVEGQQVTAETLGSRRQLLHLKVQSGSFAGWELTEGPDKTIYILLIVFALSILVWAKPLREPALPG